jgi:hypothetical protein
LIANEHSYSNQRIIQRIFTRKTVSGLDTDPIRRILTDPAILDLVQQEINTRMDTVTSLVDTLDASAEEKQFLSDLSHYMGTRQR